MRKSFNALTLIISAIFFQICSLTPVAAQSFGETPLKECWHLNSATLRLSKIASDNETVFLPLPEGIVKAVSPKTKETIWQTEIGGEISGPLIANRDVIIVASLNISEGNQKISINCLSSATGVTQWRQEVETKATAVYLFDENSVLYLVTDNGEIFSLNKSDGKLILSKNLEMQTAFPPIVKDNTLYFGNGNGKILAIPLTAVNGVEQSQKELYSLENAPTAMILSGENLYVGDKLGKVYKLNISGKKIDWSFRTGAAITDLTEVSDKLLVSSSDNYVYFISEKSGNPDWKKRLSGKSTGKVLVSGETAVFSPLGQANAVFVELKKGKTINQITLAGEAENFFTDAPSLSKNFLIFSTLQGFYAFSANDCS